MEVLENVVTISFILHSPSLHTCMVYDANTESANWSFYLLCGFKAMADGDCDIFLWGNYGLCHIYGFICKIRANTKQLKIHFTSHDLRAKEVCLIVW